MRLASRSYGDTQFDTLFGELSTRNFSLSHLREAAHRRGVRGIIAGREDTDGVRANADQTDDQIGVLFGQKHKGSPDGLFFLGQWARQEKGLHGEDVGGLPSTLTVNINGVPTVVPFGATARRKTDTPLFIAGYNLQEGERRRTRLLLQYSTPNTDFTGLQFGSRATQDLRNLSVEVRHDVQADAQHFLSVGLSKGRSDFVQDLFAEGFAGGPDRRSVFDVTTRAFQAYVRDEIRFNDRWTLIGELQYQKVRADGVFSLFDPRRRGRLLASAPSRVEKEAVLPTFILAHQPSGRSGVRLRARRLVGTVSDFQILAPTDVFLFSLADLPELGLTGDGTSYELEFDHTFGDAAFVRLGFFLQRLTNARDALANAVPQVRQRGARLTYSGTLGRNTAFYVNLDYNHAENTLADLAVANVPRFAADVGVQFLNPAGWFVQPSLVYQGKRSTTLPNNPRLGGYSLFNLRVGKRTGLRSVAFVEVLNLFDKRYDLFFPGLTQPGRTFRVGMMRRF
ncbi:MAG: TonB-dependent receptor [Abditibacteriales bacterium]|nr:TonB-dependent receptor [Abditibacteriales bacterium]MDW8367958.1 TonB-dependent receptor [Abditibacteriales bacterium]